MDTGVVKKLYAAMPRAVRRAGSGILHHALISNRIFVEQYRECERAKCLSVDEQACLQREKLLKMLRFANSNVAYYHELFNSAGFDVSSPRCIEHLGALPLLTKKTIRERFDDMQAPAVASYYRATTGGSSGVPLAINLETSSLYRERAFVYSYWARFGYDYRTNRLATFRGIDFDGHITKEDPLYASLLLNPFMLTERTLPEYVDAIDSYGCDFMQGYPSAVRNFCRLIEGSGIKPKKPFRGVFFISENVEPNTAEYISSVLGCSCHAFYGHSERAVLAEQRGPDDGYIFNSQYGYTELIEHEDGNVVCTGFLSRRMPLIRYAVDDYASASSDGTYRIEGHHSGTALVGANGERVTQTALNFHGDEFTPANGGYQLVQDRAGEAECRVLASRELTEGELNAMGRALRSKTGDAICWHVVQGVPFELTGRGKVSTIVQKMASAELKSEKPEGKDGQKLE